MEALRLQPLGQTTAVFFIVCLLPQENDYFPSAGVYAISEGVYLIRKTPDQLFSFNRRMYFRKRQGADSTFLVCPKHKLATIEKQSSDFEVTHLPLGNPKDNLLLLLEANGVSRGV